jgi:hypothetical protein
MPLTTAQQAALARLQSFYEGDNPYNSVTNPGGLRQGGHLYNFVPALKDIATVIAGTAALAVEVATNSAQSPKAVRVDGAQTYTDAEKAQGQANLGLAAVLTSFLAKAGGTLTGGLTLFFNNPTVDLKQNGGTYNGITWRVAFEAGAGNIYFQNISASGAGSDAFRMRPDGSFYIPQFGDLNARIEARAAAFADGRIAKTGDTMTGPLQVVNAQPQLKFKNSATSTGWGWLNHNDGRAYLQTYDANGVYTGNVLNIGPDGSVSILGIGDLNARIEARAKAYADIAQQQAAVESVSLSGDTMTGALNTNSPIVLTGPASWLDLVVGNVYRHRFVIRSPDGALLLRNGDSGVDNFGFGTDGALWTKQFGDLNARIEARGLAYQQVAQASAVRKDQASRQDMSGDLLVSKTYPTLGMNYPNLFYTGWQVREDSRTYLMNMSNNAGLFSVGSDGSISTQQLGDLNARIEARGAAYAAGPTSEAQYRFHAARMVYVGDLNQNSNPGGMTSPYGGNAVVTDRWTYDQGLGSYIDYAKRFRQPQFYSTTQGWVAITLA